MGVEAEVQREARNGPRDRCLEIARGVLLAPVQRLEQRRLPADESGAVAVGGKTALDVRRRERIKEEARVGRAKFGEHEGRERRPGGNAAAEPVDDLRQSEQSRGGTREWLRSTRGRRRPRLGERVQVGAIERGCPRGQRGKSRERTRADAERGRQPEQRDARAWRRGQKHPVVRHEPCTPCRGEVEQ